MTRSRFVLAGLLLAAALQAPAAAQTWDTSGNNLLNGSYYFREVLWIVADTTGSLGRAISIYGNISFDGAGKYSLNGAQVYDSDSGRAQSYSYSGTYSISASGFGFLSSPLSNGDSIYGAVSRGIFIASSTEAGFNDLFIAAPLASPAPTNSSFQGSYTFFDIDFPSGSPLDTRDSQFQMNPDGNGNIGTVRATGHIAGSGTSTVTQNLAGIRYFFSNGAANVNFTGVLAANGLIAGTKYLYFSPDGDFVFGGSPTAWDMIIGVRSPSTTPAFNGLYYQAGVAQDESTLGSGYAELNTWYGSLKAGGGNIFAHQRRTSLFNNNAIDFAYSDKYTIKADGSYDDALNHYVFGSGGAIRLGIGNGTSLGVEIAVQAPKFDPTGPVYIDPTGIVNAGSSALFTAGVVGGELITIYGTNLASTTLSDGTFPLTLGGVQVLINNRPAPIFVVSPGQISAVVPFGTTEIVASIKVVNNGVSSNTVTTYVNLTAPGVFTNPVGGIGSAAALHSDFTPVTSANPAHVGETISMYVSGLGDVSPAVSDGTPGPSNPLSSTTNTILVYIDGRKAATPFIGLAPQLIGLYQINLTVPAGTATGDVTIEIVGPDYYANQATLPVAP